MKLPTTNDERGLARVISIIIVAVIIAGVGLIGWWVMKRSVPISPSASSNANRACLKVFNDTAFCKFASGFTLSGVSYKIVYTSNDGTAGGATTITVLSDSHGNTSNSAIVAGHQADYITLSGVTYMKDQTDGSWLKFAAGVSSTPQVINPAKGLKFDITTTQTGLYRRLGSEACGSLTCLKYQIADSSTPNMISDIWFDTQTYRLQHLSAKDGSGLVADIVFSYQPVTITAPATYTNITTPIK